MSGWFTAMTDSQRNAWGSIDGGGGRWEAELKLLNHS
jgi:hypothetical protein